jgi:hypothetical protein
LNNSSHSRNVQRFQVGRLGFDEWLRTGLRYESVGGARGPVDTDIASNLTLPKVKPVDVVRQALSALEAGRDEVLVDDMTRQIKAGPSNEPGIYLNFDPSRAEAAAK